MGAQISQKKANKYTDIRDVEAMEMLVVDNEPELMATPQEILARSKPKADTQRKVHNFRYEIISAIADESIPRIIALHFKYDSAPVFDDMMAVYAKQKLQLFGSLPVAIVDCKDALADDDVEKNILRMRASFARAIDQGVCIVMKINTYIGLLYFSDIVCGAYLVSEHYVPVASMTRLPVLTTTEEFIDKCQQKHAFFGVSGGGGICRFESEGNLNVILLEKVLFLTKSPPQHITLEQGRLFQNGEDLQHTFDLS